MRSLRVNLYNRLRKSPKPWSDIHTNIVRYIKQKIESLPHLGIPHPSAFTIIEIDASNKGYGGMFKQRMHDKEQLVRYHSGIWLRPQQNCSTI